MRKIYISLASLLLVITVVVCSSFVSKTQTSYGWVTLEVSYIQTMGGHATIQDVNTGQTYDITAVDTYGSEMVPYGDYVVVSVSNNSCNPPLISSTTPAGTTFTIDNNTQGYDLYANCY